MNKDEPGAKELESLETLLESYNIMSKDLLRDGKFINTQIINIEKLHYELTQVAWSKLNPSEKLVSYKVIAKYLHKLQCFLKDMLKTDMDKRILILEKMMNFNINHLLKVGNKNNN